MEKFDIMILIQLKVLIRDLNKRITNDMENINDIIKSNKNKLSSSDKIEISNLIKNIPSPTHLLNIK